MGMMSSTPPIGAGMIGAPPCREVLRVTRGVGFGVTVVFFELTVFVGGRAEGCRNMTILLTLKSPCTNLHFL